MYLSPLQPDKLTQEKILRFCNAFNRPFCIGKLADDIGWSLERTERYLEYLVDEGLVRHATADEISRSHGTKQALMYCLTQAADVQLAHLS